MIARRLARYQLWYGRDEAPLQSRLLRAGPLTVQLEGPDLRYVRLGGLELLRRLYVAVRDANWNTIPGELSEFAVEADDESFRVSFESRHRAGELDFRWRGRIAGSPEGELVYELDGEAAAAFRYNRIGLCLLHPPATFAGRPYRARTPGGEIRDRLPLEIGPQRIADGKIWPLFEAYDALSLDLGDGGASVDLAFEGDLFEMEDQRNWTDASFKTYSTPLALGFPHSAEAGARLRQRVTLTVRGAPAGAVAAAPPAEPTVTLGAPLGRTLPAVGLALASHGGRLAGREAELLRAARPDHLRADLRLREPGFRAELERAAEAAAQLDAQLELALLLGPDEHGELAALAPLLAPLADRVARVLVFREGEASTAGRWVRLARERLAAAVPRAAFVGGTNVYFTDLNRGRPEVEAMDAVAYSLNPQVHAFDEASLVESVAAQADTVRSARAFCGDLPLVVSPVTLLPRFNPNATGPEPEPAPGELPSQVDPRQASLFGAVWTAGSVKHLAEAGAASVTYYETTGWLGLLETEAGPPVPERFPSRPGQAFPLYHVLADVGEWKGGELLEARSSDPLAVEALAVRTDEGLRLLVANMTPTAQRCAVGPLEAAEVAVRRLDEDTAASAMDEPERFRATRETLPVRGGRLELELAPFALVRVDAS